MEEIRALVGVGTLHFAKWTTDVRFGSKADIASRPLDVRFTPDSGLNRKSNDKGDKNACTS
jgi:hypothetical protein